VLTIWQSIDLQNLCCAKCERFFQTTTNPSIHQKCQTYLRAFRDLAKHCEPVNFLDNGSDELFVGRWLVLFLAYQATVWKVNNHSKVHFFLLPYNCYWAEHILV